MIDGIIETPSGVRRRAKLTTDLDIVWATVASATTVILDGETDPVTVNNYLVDPATLTTGDLVRCERTRQRLIVHGKAGGGPRIMQGQIPSSVVVGSGSATVAADGTVTFSGASSVSLNGVFDGIGADEYQAVIQATVASAADIVTRLRKAGVDVTTGNYDHITLYSDGVSAGYSQFSGQNAWAWLAGSLNGAGGWSLARATIARPNLGGYPMWESSSIARNSASVVYRKINSGGMFSNSLTGCDGMTIYPTAGTITGSIKVVKVA